MAKDLWEQTGEVGPDANDLAFIPLASLSIFWAHFSCSNYFALLSPANSTAGTIDQLAKGSPTPLERAALPFLFPYLFSRRG